MLKKRGKKFVKKEMWVMQRTKLLGFLHASAFLSYACHHHLLHHPFPILHHINASYTRIQGFSYFFSLKNVKALVEM